MDKLRLVLSALLISLLAAPSLSRANDLPPKSPPSFTWQNEKVVPIDIQIIDVSYTFDIATSTAKANATVEFKSLETGLPMLDIVPEPTKIMFDNQLVSAADFPTISDPQSSTKFRVLKRNVETGAKHVIYLEYALDSEDVTFSGETVRTGFFTSDLARGGREFFEQYGPANFEFDAVKFRFHVRVTGTDKPHEVFTNGALEETGNNQWAIDFPDFYTASSLYFHIANVGYFAKKSFTYDGLDNQIPVTIYARSQTDVDKAAVVAKKVLKENEGTYGPSTHDRIVAFITPDGGGMEHCGATMTSIWALEHEFTHFWFARGVMPANGNSGWIDEAVASWRDENYPRANGEPNRSPVNMSNFSPYKRDTNQLAYTRGADLISEFDYMFAAQGGMKPLLRDLYTNHKRQTITYQYFQQFLETATNIDLNKIFNRYVLGKSSALDFETIEPQTLGHVRFMRNHHPRPYTREELKKYR